MDIVKLCNILGQIVGSKIYPIKFPDIDTDLLSKLEITTGMIETGGVFDFNIEIMVKASHPSSAERLCLDMINKLHRKTDVEYEGYQIILITAEKPYPFFVGELENGDYAFACSFRILTCKM